MQLAQTLLAGALVIATIVYAVATIYMAREMRRGRMPRLMIEFRIVGLGTGVVRVSNVGSGAALDCQLTLTFVALHDAANIEHEWQPKVVIPGEKEHRFAPPPNGKGSVMSMDELGAAFKSVALTGTIHDPFGKAYQVDEQISDIAATWSMLKASDHLRHEDPLDSTARSLETLAAEAKQIRKKLT